MLVQKSNIFVTGGAGFIGSNLVHSLLSAGYNVTVIDNLSRQGVEKNLEWLQTQNGDALIFLRMDVRDFSSMKEILSGADIICHLAAQVAVTTSVDDPRTDFEINALGTLNVLESARLSGRNPLVIFTSTNKVYGNLDNIQVIEGDKRYFFKDREGVNEKQPLDFHSPYGCSKGAADQYVRDYARIYGIPTVVFRMSCIYGTRQFGNEDQGWVAHFMISHILGRPITIYGNGKQVRDILFVEDLIRAMRMLIDKSDVVGGQIYNIGGGPGNTISAWLEMREKLRGLTGETYQRPRMEKWRPGDQPIYVSDISKARQDFGWIPNIGVDEGLKKLHDWVQANRTLFT